MVSQMLNAFWKMTRVVHNVQAIHELKGLTDCMHIHTYFAI